jgi:hypothetical protein
MVLFSIFVSSYGSCENQFQLSSTIYQIHSDKEFSKFYAEILSGEEVHFFEFEGANVVGIQNTDVELGSFDFMGRTYKTIDLQNERVLISYSFVFNPTENFFDYNVKDPFEKLRISMSRVSSDTSDKPCSDVLKQFIGSLFPNRNKQRIDLFLFEDSVWAMYSEHEFINVSRSNLHHKLVTGSLRLSPRIK